MKRFRLSTTKDSNVSDISKMIFKFSAKRRQLLEQLLRDEGVHFDTEDRIDMSRFRWNPGHIDAASGK